MKANLLFISAHNPSLESRQAGEKTAYRNLVLLEKEYNVILFVLNGVSECISTRPNHYHLTIRRFDKIFSVFRHPFYPVILLTRNSSCARDKLFELLYFFNPVRVHCEWSQAAFFYFIHARRLKTKRFFSINVHDVAIQFTERQFNSSSIIRRLLFFDFFRVRYSEAKLYSFADKIIVPSIKDRDILVKRLSVSASKIYDVPLSFSRYGQQSDPTLKDILFWGALNRPENDQAANILVKKIQPKLNELGYTGCVHVVGSAPPSWLISMNNKRLCVPGYVPNPSIEFAKCGIAVFPILAGAGVKVKVLECLSFGIPVITTSIGAEGLDVNAAGIIVVNDVDKMANAIMALSLDQDERVERSKRGLKYVDLYYNDGMLNSIL